MFCSKCGKELPNEAVFCQYCGAQTSQPASVGAAPAVNHASICMRCMTTYPAGVKLCPECNVYLAPLTDESRKNAEINAAKIRQKEAQEKEDILRCPRCRSTQVSTDRKKFSMAKTLIGGAATGGIGALWGFSGTRKILCKCLKCRHQWTR
jgi:RNA polymerase subunit RPABC4/transcription elongation factor Spt4